MKKRQIIRYILISIVIIVASILAYILNFYVTTLTGKEMRLYCQNNTSTNSTDFMRYETTSLQQYAFWVAEYNEQLVQQEMFIFRKKLLFNLFDVNRYIYSHQAIGNMDQIVGSVLFNPRDIYGKKSQTSTIIFFSSNPSHIAKFILKFEENTALCTMEKKLTTQKPFVVEFTGIGVKDNVTRDFREIKFYDENNKVISNIP